MDTNLRREQLKTLLSTTEQPLKGQELAKRLSVSRQVIVQDIAILRAQGAQIVATPAGYLILKQPNRLVKVIASQHDATVDAMKKELELMIHYGATVVDVIVEHPVYGEIRAVLNLRTLADVQAFIEKSATYKKPLSLLTDGNHFHTIEVDSDVMFDQIKSEMKRQGMC